MEVADTEGDDADSLSHRLGDARSTLSRIARPLDALLPPREVEV